MYCCWGRAITTSGEHVREKRDLIGNLNADPPNFKSPKVTEEVFVFENKKKKQRTPPHRNKTPHGLKKRETKKRKTKQTRKATPKPFDKKTQNTRLCRKECFCQVQKRPVPHKKRSFVFQMDLFAILKFSCCCLLLSQADSWKKNNSKMKRKKEKEKKNLNQDFGSKPKILLFVFFLIFLFGGRKTPKKVFVCSRGCCVLGCCCVWCYLCVSVLYLCVVFCLYFVWEKLLIVELSFFFLVFSQNLFSKLRRKEKKGIMPPRKKKMMLNNKLVFVEILKLKEGQPRLEERIKKKKIKIKKLRNFSLKI